MRGSGALICALALLVSCTGSPDEPEPAESRKAATPPLSSDPSGTVTFGVLGEPRTFDPYNRLASDLTYALARPVYPSLYMLLPDGTPEPYLAEDMEAIPGGVRVSIRAAQWSDGSAITSGDVVASARRASLPSGFALADSVRAAGSPASH